MRWNRVRQGPASPAPRPAKADRPEPRRAFAQWAVAWLAGAAIAFIALLCGAQASKPVPAMSPAPRSNATRSEPTSDARPAVTMVADSEPAAPASPAAAGGAGSCAPSQGPRRDAVRVIDGETVVLDDGSEVRLAALLAPDPPEAGAPDTRWPPANAARQRLESLVLGRPVELRTELAVPDRYGRLRAQLTVEGQGERQWVQARMVEEGLARVEPSAAARGCIALLLALEDGARRAGRGLWAHPAYAIRQARKTREIERYRHSFQIIEGEVVSVGERKRRVFLNFGKRWSDDLTVTVTGRNRRRFEDAGLDFSGLEGRRVRVRGWIESWNGPVIRASEPGQIEVLGGEGAGKKRSKRRKDGGEAGAETRDGAAGDLAGRADGQATDDGLTGSARGEAAP